MLSDRLPTQFLFEYKSRISLSLGGRKGEREKERERERE
jgi:hypothetical protein